jgi:hypothetical protein
MNKLYSRIVQGLLYTYSNIVVVHHINAGCWVHGGSRAATIVQLSAYGQKKI